MLGARIAMAAACCAAMGADGSERAAPWREFTAMTYNIRIGLGDETKGWYRLPEGDSGNLPEIARVISAARPDFVALQEVDCRCPRTGLVDQTEFLAKATGMHGTFAGKAKRESGEYGLAVLTREKPVSWRKIALGEAPKDHMRILLAVELPSAIVCSTHFTLNRQWRPKMAEKVKEAFAGCDKPVMIGGDFNALPGTPEMVAMEAAFTPVSGVGLKTFPSGRPNRQLDYIFVDREHANAVRTVSAEALRPSPSPTDHLPVVARLMVGWQ